MELFLRLLDFRLEEWLVFVVFYVSEDVSHRKHAFDFLLLFLLVFEPTQALDVVASDKSGLIESVFLEGRESFVLTDACFRKLLPHLILKLKEVDLAICILVVDVLLLVLTFDLLGQLFDVRVIWVDLLKHLHLMFELLLLVDLAHVFVPLLLEELLLFALGDHFVDVDPWPLLLFLLTSHGLRR